MPSPTINQSIPRPRTPRPIVSIGAGGIVHDAHYPAYAKAGYPVAGLFDPRTDRAEYMADKFGVPAVHASLAEAVRKAPADAVFDVAVPAAHIASVLPELPDGSPVLIQKPLGDNLEQARALRDICSQKGLIAAVNFQMRWAPFTLAARSLIDQGAIGDIVDLEIRVCVETPWHMWPFLQGLPHAEIYYHSIHHIDLVRSFLGEPAGVQGVSVSHPDLPAMTSSRSLIALDYNPMLRVHIDTNHFHRYGLRHQEAHVKWEGTSGAIKATLGILMNYPEGMPDQFDYCVSPPGAANPEWHSLELEAGWFPDAFIGSMGSLMRFVNGEAEELPTSVADAFRTMAVADAACRSSESGSVKPEAA